MPARALIEMFLRKRLGNVYRDPLMSEARAGPSTDTPAAPISSQYCSAEPDTCEHMPAATKTSALTGSARAVLVLCRSAGEPLARQSQRDGAPLAKGFLDQALHVQRPVPVRCVEQEREVGHA
jgi:hypothetical protein